MPASFLSGEFLLPIPCWLLFYLGSFSYTSRAGFIFMWGVDLTHPVLASFLSGEFLLHIPCWLHFYVGSFSYTSRASFIFIWGISLTHPIMASFLCGEFLLHTPCWLFSPFFLFFFKYLLSGEYLEHTHCSFLFNFFIWGVSLTHPVLASFLYREFLLHIACWHNRGQ